MKKVAVIMAGGSGERFWPLSRKKRPKQLLKLLSDKTMLEESILRVSDIINPEDIFIITSEVLLEPIRSSICFIPPQNIIAEPYKRNTAPCLALAAAYILAKYSKTEQVNQILISVLTADQSISPISKFQNTINNIIDYISKYDVLATIGILPNRPETGYGYIQIENKSIEISKAVKFHEKPNLAKAEEFLKEGSYLWNSGMFFWRLDVFINSMVKFLPEVGNSIPLMSELYNNHTDEVFPASFEPIKEIFYQMPDISIDYGLMEKADNVVCAQTVFEWDDIGAWDSLDRLSEKDNDNNIINGKAVLVDVTNSTIINESNKIIFAGIGLDDFVVVITDDSVMISPKNRAQEVKKCVEKMKNNNLEDWL